MDTGELRSSKHESRTNHRVNSSPTVQLVTAPVAIAERDESIGGAPIGIDGGNKPLPMRPVVEVDDPATGAVLLVLVLEGGGTFTLWVIACSSEPSIPMHRLCSSTTLKNKTKCANF